MSTALTRARALVARERRIAVAAAVRRNHTIIARVDRRGTGQQSVRSSRSAVVGERRESRVLIQLIRGEPLTAAELEIDRSADQIVSERRAESIVKSNVRRYARAGIARDDGVAKIQRRLINLDSRAARRAGVIGDRAVGQHERFRAAAADRCDENAAALLVTVAANRRIVDSQAVAEKINAAAVTDGRRIAADGRSGDVHRSAAGDPVAEDYAAPGIVADGRVSDVQSSDISESLGNDDIFAPVLSDDRIVDRQRSTRILDHVEAHSARRRTADSARDGQPVDYQVRAFAHLENTIRVVARNQQSAYTGLVGDEQFAARRDGNHAAGQRDRADAARRAVRIICRDVEIDRVARRRSVRVGNRLPQTACAAVVRIGHDKKRRLDLKNKRFRSELNNLLKKSKCF